MKTKGKKTRQKPPAKASPKPRQTPKKKGKGKGDPPGTHRDGDGKLRNSKGQYASDPNTPDKPTHYAKEKSYKRAEGKKMELPANKKIQTKDGKKTAKQVASERHAELQSAKKAKKAEERAKQKAAEAKKKGDKAAAKKHEAEAAKQKQKAKEHEQKAREHSEALGDAATDHAVGQMFKPRKAEPVAKDRGPNTFDNTYEIKPSPPPPKYVIAESKGGEGKNKSSRKGDNPGERYEQGTPEYKNQLLDKQATDPKASDAQRAMATDIQDGAPADYVKVTQPFDADGNPKPIKVTEYENQSYDADGNKHPKRK